MNKPTLGKLADEVARMALERIKLFDIVAQELKPDSTYLLVIDKNKVTMRDMRKLRDILDRLNITSVAIFIEDSSGVRVEILPNA